MSLDQNTKALVTGASSGIGEATARALRAKGVKVYAAARRLDRLEKLEGQYQIIDIAKYRALSLSGYFLLRTTNMMRSNAFAALLFCFLISLTACSSEQQASAPEITTPAASVSPADIVLTNAYVYTVDAKKTIAKAVAIRGHEIVYIGDAAGVKKFIGSATETRDLEERMIMPGLHDMHIHATGVVEPDMCDFKGEAKSLEAMAPFLKGCIEKYQIPDGEWLVVLQWLFSSGNQPSEKLKTVRAALDAASSKHPIIMWGDDGHHAAVNTLALAQAKDRDGNVVGMNRETINTVFADFREMIAVDENGEPTGGLNEGARMLVRPEFIEDMMGLQGSPDSVMPAVAKKLASFGITSIQDPFSVPELLERYDWLAKSGHMTFRLRTAFYRDSEDSHKPEGLAQIPAHVEQFKMQREKLKNSELIQPNAVKLFADAVLEGNPFAQPPTLPVAGILGEFKQPIFAIDTGADFIEISGYVDLDSDTCAGFRQEPGKYSKPESIKQFVDKHGYQPQQCILGSGILEHSQEYIKEYVRQMTDAGFHVHIHALSDRGVRVATEAFAAVKHEADANGLTQSLTHVQLAHPDDVKRIGELGLYVAFTYVWIFPNVEYDVMVVPFIDKVNGIADLYNPGHYYMQNVYPVKSTMDAGGILTWGSDAPVDSRDPIPFPSMQAAVTREATGVVMNAGQRISIHAALAAYTINGARLMGHDKRLGSIEVGKTADLIVLNRNVVELAEQGQADKIGETQVDMTFFNGKLVYERAP